MKPDASKKDIFHAIIYNIIYLKGENLTDEEINEVLAGDMFFKNEVKRAWMFVRFYYD